MRLIKSYEIGGEHGFKASKVHDWESEDNFVFTVHEQYDEETVAIDVMNPKNRTCTTSIYKKFISQYGDRYEVSYGYSGFPPSIKCRREDLNLIMGLIESMDKSRLYFDETI